MVSTRKNIDKKAPFSKVAGCISMQKSAAFLHVNSKLVGEVIRKSNSFVIPSKIKNYLRINPAKEVGTLYNNTQDI